MAKKSINQNLTTEQNLTPDQNLTIDTIDTIIEQPEIIEQQQQPQPEVTLSKVDIIINALPDNFTPATLDKLFKFNDGGKTVRRHLRKYFANEMGHSLKDKWGFTKSSNKAIIEYFAGKYEYDLTVLTTK